MDAALLIEEIQEKIEKHSKPEKINYPFRVIDGGQKFEDQPPFTN